MAQAAPLESFLISTDADRQPDVVVSGSWTVPAGYCEVQWYLAGAGGGYSTEQDWGDGGGELRVSTPVTAGDEYTITAGGAGGDARDGGAGGTGAPGFEGAHGEVGTDNAGTVPSDGGGGGGATTVIGTGVSLVAVGGDGAMGLGDAGGAGGAGGGGPEIIVDWPGALASHVELGSATGSVVTGTVVPCPPEPVAPEAPTGLRALAEDGQVTVTFTPTWASDEYGTDADSWEYSLDGGTWTAVPAADAWGDLEFTLTGLTNGTTYSIRVRGVSETAGAGTASAAVSATPAVPIGAPADVVATAGPSSVRITWSPPTNAGTFPVSSYVVIWNGGEMGGAACEDVPANAERVCVFPADPGSTGYGFGVWAVDTKGNAGVASELVSAGEIPAPTVPDSVPTSDGNLDVPAEGDGPIAGGAEIEVSGSGYLPGSTVTLVVYSEPTVIGSALADASGNFSTTVTLPEGLAAGAHTLVASGVDADGNPRFLTLPIDVAAGADELAFTGFEVAGPLTGGLLAVLVGSGLVVASRRRSAA